jgi:hypothetical protein
MFRLFVLQGRNLTGATQQRLETVILKGPPREMYGDDLYPDQWQDIVDRGVWLHLAKLNSSGLELGRSAADRFAKISSAYPPGQLTATERDEFLTWMSSSSDPNFEPSRNDEKAPRNRHELVQWLKKPRPKQRPFYEDKWREICRTRFFHSVFALSDLAKDSVWPIDSWREALQAWADEGYVLRSWQYVAPLVQTMPDSVLQEIAHAVTWWIESVSKLINCHENILYSLCIRLLALPLEVGTGSRIIQNGIETYDPVSSAINHPVGHVTKALINLLFKLNPNDNDLLPSNLKPIFTRLCDCEVDRFRHGRVLLASRLIALFRVDRTWTEQFLLPLFDWSNPVEARATWEGFLWSPRLYQPLLLAFKLQFLDCANHYADLGKHQRQFASFLTYVALDQTDGYTVDEFQSAFSALPKEGLEESAQTLSQALAGAADQREDYWINRAHPFWQQIWPKSRDLPTPRIAESLARMVIAARGEFPAALSATRDWLLPIEYPDYVVHMLSESDLCIRFPADALLLLSAVISDQQWAPTDLSKCLADIARAAQHLSQDARHMRLQEYARRRGM